MNASLEQHSVRTVEPSDQHEPVTTMKPWEQHHAVIRMPRFAYNPIPILRQHSTGFLITCTFRREKSATKEALTLLKKYIISTAVGLEESLAKEPPSRVSEIEATIKETADKITPLSDTHLAPSSDEVVVASFSVDETQSIHNKSKTEVVMNVDESIGKETGNPIIPGKEIGKYEDEDESPCTLLDTVEMPDEGGLNNGIQNFILVKLATMGVIYISAVGNSSSSVLSVASRIVTDVQTGTQAAPQWCHRLLPVQATCSVNREELQAVVSQLVKDHLQNEIFSDEHPVNYAVAFNRRGVIKSDQSSVGESTEPTVFGREECIKTVTAAVEQVTTNIRVDLTAPQMVVIVELIPVTGVQTSLICAVSVLPGDLVLSKPKLNVKPLTPLNPKKRKHLR